MAEAKAKGSWELTTANDVAEALEWIRRRTKGGALMLVAVGVNSLAYAIDPNMPPADAMEILRTHARCLYDGLEATRRKRETRGATTRKDG